MNMLRRGRGSTEQCCMRVISEEVDGGDIGHVQDELRFHRVRWNFRLVYGFDDSEVILVTSSFSLMSKPILHLFQIQWAFHRKHFTGLVPIRIPILITLWITPTLILRHRIVQEMMEDQFMISICMVMKGMRNGYLTILWHPFPTSLFYGYISWVPRNLPILPIATSTSSPTVMQPIPSNRTALVC